MPGNEFVERNDEAWEFVRAVAALEQSLTPEVAARVLDTVRQRAITVLHDSGVPHHVVAGIGADGLAETFFGLTPALAHIEPVEEIETDLLEQAAVSVP